MKGGKISLFIVVLCGILLCAWQTVYRVGEGEVGVASYNREGSAVRLISSGWHLKIPLFETVYRFPRDWQMVRLEIPYKGNGREILFEVSCRVKISLNHEKTLFKQAGSRRAFSPPGTLVRDFFTAKLEMGEADWAFLSDLPGAIMLELGQWLNTSGFLLGTATWRSDLPEQERIAFFDRSIRAKVKKPVRPVVIIGVDGADWLLVNRLCSRGLMPAFSSLLAEGCSGTLQPSSELLLSPTIWTNVATGRSPDAHGIYDFLAWVEETESYIPVSSSVRRVQALWNLFSAFDRNTRIIGWWGSWPAEKVNGVIISDRIAYSLFNFPEEIEKAVPSGLTYPPGFYETILPLKVLPGDISFEEVRRYLHISRRTFKEALEDLDNPGQLVSTNAVAQFLKILASTRTYWNIGRTLLKDGQPDLFAIYFQGIDSVSHLFAAHTRPASPLAAPADVLKFTDAVEAFYILQDRIIGDLLSRCTSNPAIFILSDHGFYFGEAGPRGLPAIERGGARWHKRGGIFIARGPEFVRGELGDIEALELAPAVLYLAGLPVAENMEGGFPFKLFRENALKANSPSYVCSYESGKPSTRATIPDTSRYDALVIEELKALGYIQPETINYHINRGEIYIRNKEYPAAIKEFKKALALHPGEPGASVRLARAFFALGECKQALQIIEGIDHARRQEKKILLTEIRIRSRCGQPGEVDALLQQAQALYPDDPDVQDFIARNPH